jgi:hypothetical protein
MEFSDAAAWMNEGKKKEAIALYELAMVRLPKSCLVRDALAGAHIARDATA